MFSLLTISLLGINFVLKFFLVEILSFMIVDLILDLGNSKKNVH